MGWSCFYCGHDLIWSNDFMCDEVNFCTCEKGIVSYWSCSECNTEYQITKDCEGE